MSTIHIDNIQIPKSQISSSVFGLAYYAKKLGNCPPFKITASTTNYNPNYLSIIKDNNITIVDEPPRADLEYSTLGEKKIEELKLLPNTGTKMCGEKICNCYIDWENMQISRDNISKMLSTSITYVNGIMPHDIYKIYVFLNLDKKSQSIKKYFNLPQGSPKSRIFFTNIIKTKTKISSLEISKFISNNIKPLESLCIISGNRGFSPLMVSLSHCSHNVFLIHNSQSIQSFISNKHWIGSVCIDTLIIKKSKSSIKILKKSKPCKFFNQGTCNFSSEECPFLHVCDTCGFVHPSTIHSVRKKKKAICTNYNKGCCSRDRMTCDYLHICITCQEPHSDCSEPRTCWLCGDVFYNNIEFMYHMIGKSHNSKVAKLKEIMAPSHVLII